MENNIKNFGGLRLRGEQKKTVSGLPAVTVVTVVLNDVEHIEKTILSVLNQDYENLEYIIIDGVSTDGTLDIVKKYEKNIDLWVSEPDQGLYYAMNKGADLATGEWIYFLNSGDYLYNNRVLEKVFLNNMINGDLIYGSFVGTINGQKRICEAFDNMSGKLWRGPRACLGNIFIKTEIMKKNKFDTNYKVSADGDLLMKCIVNGCGIYRTDAIIFEVGTLGFSNKHWLLARKENWLISWKYCPSIKTIFFHLWGLIYFVVFRFFKRFMSAIGVYDFLKKYYRRWFGDKIMREKYNYKEIEDSHL